MLKVCDGCKDGLDTEKDGSPLARNGAALAPFRANGAHPSLCYNPVQEQSLNPFAAHARRGVIKGTKLN